MCTFDIVSTLGPQSQVRNPAEASVFIQSSIPSTRSASIPITSITFSATPLLKCPTEQSGTRHRYSSPITGAHRIVPNTQSPAPDPKIRERVRSPHCNLITNSHICGGIFQQARTITSFIPIPQISLIVAIASNKSMISMENKEYGK